MRVRHFVESTLTKWITFTIFIHFIQNDKLRFISPNKFCPIFSSNSGLCNFYPHFSDFWQNVEKTFRQITRSNNRWKFKNGIFDEIKFSTNGTSLIHAGHHSLVLIHLQFFSCFFLLLAAFQRHDDIDALGLKIQVFSQKIICCKKCQGGFTPCLFLFKFINKFLIFLGGSCFIPPLPPHLTPPWAYGRRRPLRKIFSKIKFWKDWMSGEVLLSKHKTMETNPNVLK